MTSTIAVPTDPAAEPDIDHVVDRVLADSTTVLEYLSAWLGLELGLFDALYDHGPATATELATRAGIDPRYAREWLEEQTVAGYLVCTDPSAAPDEREFRLPAAVAAVLLDPESGAHLGPLFEMVEGIASVLSPLVDAYRSGGGVSYAEFGEGIRHGIGGLNGPTFDAQLATWMAQFPDVHERLRGAEEPRILDLGCGVGRSSIALARLYPRATVRGVDLDAASIAEARAAAAAAGVADRVTFVLGDAAAYVDDARYDLVTIFEALHDIGDPVGTLRTARAHLRDGAPVYVADEKVAHEFTPDADVVERLQYGFSVLHCLPATMAEDPAIASGTILRMPTVVEWAHAAGFDTVRDVGIDDLFWRHYRIDAAANG